MSKMLGKYSWIECKGWRFRSSLKEVQRRIARRRREMNTWKKENN